MSKSKTSLYWALALIFVILAFLWNMAIGFMSWYFYLDPSDMRRVSLGILFIVAVLFAKKKHTLAVVLYAASALATAVDLFVSVKEYAPASKGFISLIISCAFEILVYVCLIYFAVQFGIKSKKHQRNPVFLAVFALPALFSLFSDLSIILLKRDFVRSPVESTVLSFIGIAFLGLFYYESSIEN